MKENSALSAKGKQRQKAQRVETYDFRKAGQFGGKQFQSLSAIHETFARNLSLSLGAALRTSLDLTLVSIEPFSYESYLQQVSEIAYLGSLSLSPLESVAAMELDPAIAFPMMDLLLGGEGRPELQVRAITEIEEQILETVVKMICQELRSVWKPLMGAEIHFDRRFQQPQFHSMMPGNERIVVLHFDVVMGEAKGFLNLIFPTIVTNALLRRLSQQWMYRQRPAAAPVPNGRTQDRLQDSAFDVQLVLADLQVPLRELLALTPGKILGFKHRVTDPALLLVSGKGMFSAFPVASGNLRAAQVHRRLQISAAAERNWKDGK
jgi:flagellar motor switch protein FliM